MEMGFGKYKDKPVAWVLLEDPEYFVWMSSNSMTNKAEYKFAMNLIQVFDSKPFINAVCNGKCKGVNHVTRLSLYNGIYNGNYWFCNECSPYECGAISGNLTEIRTFSQALYNRDSKSIISAMANAKGLVGKRTKKALKEFFGY